MDRDNLEKTDPHSEFQQPESLRCDAVVSLWDPWLSQLYFETLYEECKGKLH